MQKSTPSETRLELYRSPYFLIDKRSGDCVLRMQRSSLPGDPSTAMQELEHITKALHGVDRTQLGLLFDMRAVPINPDPEFARAAQKFRESVFKDFCCVVLLASTATGKLQAQRFSREEGTGFVANTEEEATERLRQEVQRRRTRRPT